MADIITQTDRLILRDWRIEDRAIFLAHLNTPAVMRWLGGVQDEATYAAAFDRLDSYARDYGHTFWIVERKADSTVLGFCGLKRLNNEGAPNPGEMEIGWRLREDAWGQGYAREAASACLDLAFDRFAAPRVVALTLLPNRASWGLMERLGMVYDPSLDFIDPRFPDDIVKQWRIDAADWPAAREVAR